MSDAENAVRVAQAALQAAIINAREQGFRVKWQVDGAGEHSVVVDGGPEPIKAAPPPSEPIATFGGGRRFAKSGPATEQPVAPPEPAKD